VRTSVWSGGLACVAGVGLLALCLPGLMRYDVRTNEHALRLRKQRETAAQATEQRAPSPTPPGATP
jgi:hypothetical protein